MPRLRRGGGVLLGVRALTQAFRLGGTLLAVVVVALLLLVPAAAAPSPVAAQDRGPITRLRLDVDCVARWDGDDVGGSLSVRVRGSGFTPGTNVALRFAAQSALDLSAQVLTNAVVLDRAVGDRVAQAVEDDPALETVSVSDTGNIDTPLTVFWPMSEGAYLVTASTQGGGPTGTAVLLVPCQPSLQITTDCNAQPEGAPPGLVRFSGSGFDAGATVEVSLSGSGTQGLIGSVVADEAGAFVLEERSLEGLSGTYLAVADAPGSEQQAFAVFEAPCPVLRLTAQPECAPAGAPPDRFELLLEGSGFHPGTTALVTFGAAGSDEVWSAPVARDGTISVRIEPYRRAPDSYTIRIRNEPAELPARIATTSITLPCIAREVSISVEPVCTRPALSGDAERVVPIAVSGVGFGRGRVTIVFDAEARVAAQEFIIEAAEDGRFEATITPLAPPPGSYLISAMQAADNATRAVELPTPLVATATFRAPCRDREPPPLTIEPDCGPEATGIEDAYAILVSGSGFFRGSPVLITFGDDEGPGVAVLAEQGGRFSTTILVRGRSEGTYLVRAVQRGALEREIAAAEGTFTVPCAIDPNIAIRPDYGPAGYSARVVGTDFRPGTTVTLTWDRGIEAGRTFSVAVEPDGSFETYIFILPNDFGGARTLRADLAGQAGALPDVQADYVVVPGPGLPGARNDGLVTRR